MAFADLVREPAIHLRVRRGARLGKSDDGASWVVELSGGGVQPVGPCKPEHAAANEQLAAGASLDTLRRTALTQGGVSSAVAYVIWLQRLCDWGILELPLVDEHGVRAVMLPQQSPFVAPALPAESPSEEGQLDRFACIRRDEDAWLLESPLNAVRFRLDDLAALDSAVVRRALCATGFLGPTHPEPKSRREARVQWEFHDLMFHAHHRVGFHRDPMGGQFPYIGEMEPLPAVRAPWPGKRITLPRAPEDTGQEPFASLLERRRSKRLYDENRPISLGDLGALLDRAARIRSLQTVPVGNLAGRTAEFEISHRPYPNGGASYELEIYPVVDRSEDLDSGLYHYDAANHELVRLSGRTPEVEQMMVEAHIATANMAHPQILLAIAARFARVMWKYKAISYSTILRNAGVLYQTLYLAATELGLSPCGIGAGDSALFARMTGLDPMVEGTVGEFILGGPPHPNPESAFGPVNRPGADDGHA